MVLTKLHQLFLLWCNNNYCIITLPPPLLLSLWITTSFLTWNLEPLLLSFYTTLLVVSVMNMFTSKSLLVRLFPYFPFQIFPSLPTSSPPFLFLSFTLAKIAFLPPSQCPFCPPSLSSFLSHPSLLYLFSLPFPILFPTPPLSFFSLPFPFFLPTPLAICCGMIIPSHPAAIPIPHSPFPIPHFPFPIPHSPFPIPHSPD